MSRDMKRKVSPEARPAKRGGMFMGIFLGLVLGLCLAAGVAWYTSRSATPFVNKNVVRDKPATEVPRSATGGAPTASVSPATGEAPTTAAVPPAPVPIPGKPGDPAPAVGEQRRFQFYDILQGKSEPVPMKEGVSARLPEPAADLKPTAQATYLQAAAFQKSGDAENLKATLAMNGIESVIQQVIIQDKTWFRVRLGPYSRAEDANRIKQELVKFGLEATVVR